MTAEERLAEVASILATGFLRMHEKGLASQREVEALCDKPVDGTGAGVTR
jgi:hypothetical protein